MSQVRLADHVGGSTPLATSASNSTREEQQGHLEPTSETTKQRGLPKRGFLPSTASYTSFTTLFATNRIFLRDRWVST